MYVVALTGGIGSGKSEAARVFQSLNIPVVDLDVISHQLTAPGMPLVGNIAQAFGNEVINADGSLNRAQLRSLVFADDKKRETLNAILHPAIFSTAKQALAEHANAPYVVLAIPLLDQNSPILSQIKRILVIDADESTQIARVKARSGLGTDEIKRIIAAQTPREVRLQMADDVVTNNGDLQQLVVKITNLHHKYLKNALSIA